MVSPYRAVHDLWLGDAAFAALVIGFVQTARNLAGGGPRMASVRPCPGPSTCNTPALGTLRYDYANFQANDDPALKLAIYTRH